MNVPLEVFSLSYINLASLQANTALTNHFLCTHLSDLPWLEPFLLLGAIFLNIRTPNRLFVFVFCGCNFVISRNCSQFPVINENLVQMISPELSSVCDIYLKISVVRSHNTSFSCCQILIISHFESWSCIKTFVPVFNTEVKDLVIILNILWIITN